MWVVFLLKYEMAVLMDFELLALEEVQIGTQPTLFKLMVS